MNVCRRLGGVGCRTGIDDDIYHTSFNLIDAVKELVKHLGLGISDRSDKVPEGKSAHTLLMSGIYRGGHEVLARARLALDPVDMNVTMNLTVRFVTFLLLCYLTYITTTLSIYFSSDDKQIVEVIAGAVA